MAASYLSDRSSIAPVDFDVSDSFDEGNGVISVAVENCQLCRCSRRPFYCPNCVNTGDFCHSNNPNKHRNLSPQHKGRPISGHLYIYSDRTNERYADKMVHLRALRKERAILLEKFKLVASKRTAIQDKTLQANLAKQRIDLLSQAVAQESGKHSTEKEELVILQKSNTSVVVRVSRVTEKKRRIREYIDKLKLHIDNRNGELAICEDQLDQLRKQHIRQLVDHIFPITQIQPRSDFDSTTQSYVSELAEARHTAYIRGRWVYSDNGSEHQYSIVKPTLPGNGDYTSYLNWLLDNKSGNTGPDPLTGDDHPAFTIGAALTYTAQLLQLTAYFLDVNLPENMCYSNFCRDNMSERRFNRLVYKLNHNVLYLCFSQRVDPELLHPRHTIHNILMLLKTPHLGRLRPFAVNSDLIQSIEATREVPGGNTSPDDGEISDEDTFPGADEVDNLPDLEWERVPISLPEVEIPGGSRSGDSAYYPSSTLGGTIRSGENTQATSTVMSGLMTSAAASVTSMWRGAFWKS